jgi:hypothetical protein
LTESVAVLWTLVERHPSDWCGGIDARSCDLPALDAFAASTVYSAVGVADYPARWTTSRSAAARAAVERAAVTRMQLGWDIIARAFRRRRASFSAIDRRSVTSILPTCRAGGRCATTCAEHHPTFAALMQRVDELPEVLRCGPGTFHEALAIRAGRGAGLRLLAWAMPSAAQMTLTMYAAYVGSDGVENVSTNASRHPQLGGVCGGSGLRPRRRARGAALLQPAGDDGLS